MSGCRDFFPLFVSAFFTDKERVSCFSTCCIFMLFYFIIVVFLRNALTIRKLLPTVCTIDITCITFFCTGGFFYIADFRMLVSSRRNLFCLCFLADRAGVGLYARCGTGRFCCDRPFAPNMFMGIVPFSIKGHAIYRSTDCQGFYSLFILWFSILSGKATSLFCHVLRKRQVSNRTI